MLLRGRFEVSHGRMRILGVPWHSSIISPIRGKPPRVFEIDAPAPTSCDTTGRIAEDEAKVHALPGQLVDDFCSTFSSVLSEYSYWVDDAWVEGEIPAELEGTYFRNGPGLQVAHEDYERHPFDGDGCLMSLAIKGGRAHFRNKYIKTPRFLEEQEAGKPIYRSAFCKGAVEGNLFNPFDLNFKSPANTGVLHWGGQLMALWEGGLPFLLDPQTLDTIGESDLEGKIGSRLSGHYRILTNQDTKAKRLVTFAAEVFFGSVNLIFYEFDEAGNKVCESSQVLKGQDITFVHDIVVTDSHYILVLGPVKFDVKRFLAEYIFGKCSIAQCLEYNPKGRTRVMMYPRPGQPGCDTRKPVELSTIAFFPFHHVNAFDVTPDAKQVVVDTIGWNKISFDASKYDMSLDMYVGSKRPEYYRLLLDLESGTVQHRRMLERAIEFPSSNALCSGQRHRYCYAIGVENCMSSPSQVLMKVDVSPELGVSILLDGADLEEHVILEQHRFEPRQFPGEPMFIPRKDGSGAEDDGWVIVVCHNAERKAADVVILDAQLMSQGPVATIRLPHIVPSSFHGHFTSDYVGPDPNDETLPQWEEPLLVRQI